MSSDSLLHASSGGPTGEALAETVSEALLTGEALPGTAGFAGDIDGRLVRDVLGRQPLFFEAESVSDWSPDPTDLDSPRRLPAGHVLDRRDAGGTAREPEQVWTLPDPTAEHDETAAISAVEDAIRTSLETLDPTGLAIAFSGGVDSAVVASGAPEAPCYVVGFEGAHDIEAAREAAATMDRDLRVVALEHRDLERAVPEIVRATGRANAMDVQIALPIYLVSERIADDGFDRVALGQGADELFGGYAKVVTPAEDHRVEAKTVRGARLETVQTLPGQLERDVLTVRAAGVEPVTPLLHDRVVRAALALPDSLLATEHERKIALRRAATGLVPDAVRSAEKKAMQYGSYAARELDRLARQAGFKRRMDDHVGQYIDALVEEAGVAVPAVRD